MNTVPAFDRGGRVASSYASRLRWTDQMVLRARTALRLRNPTSRIGISLRRSLEKDCSSVEQCIDSVALAQDLFVEIDQIHEIIVEKCRY